MKTDTELKQKEIYNLTVKMTDLLFKSVKVAAKPPSKYKRTNLRRMYKIIGLSLQVGLIQNQIRIIRSQPIKPLFKEGGISSVREHGEEMILSKQGKLIKLNNN